MGHFTIKSISVMGHDFPGNYAYKAVVSVEVEAKYWKALQKAKNLGQLYGIDISNQVYALSKGLIPASHPTVSDEKNARNGIKTVVLTYYFQDHNKAEALGLEVKRLANGEAFCAYGSYKSIEVE